MIRDPNERTGVHAEYEYVAQVCGVEDVGWKRERQEYFSRDGGKRYGKLTVRLCSGELRRFCFDFTDFLRKAVRQ